MKCPKCGRWNRASVPACIHCGTPLSGAAGEPEWRKDLRDDKPSAAYLRADEETGALDDTPDQHQVLADEMTELKKRKAEGVRLLRRMRMESAARGDTPASPGADASAHPGNAFWRMEDDPATTVRPGKPETDARPEEPEVQVYYNEEPPEHPYDTARSYNPMWPDREYSASVRLPPVSASGRLPVRIPSRRRGKRLVLRTLLILLMVGLAGAAGFFGYHYYMEKRSEATLESAAVVTETTKNGLPAHTIMIPGTDGSQIYIRELRTSYVVTGGFATIEIEDHTWYDDYENFLDETLDVTLNPFVKTASGQQKPLDVITYTVHIPESQITLVSPDSYRYDVAATMFTVELDVLPGSKVVIKGDDVSDTVNSETGRLSYNATVQPIGDNVFDIHVRSKYCRETVVNLILYRQPQDIPLDLAADTYTSTSNPNMLVNMTTMPGAYVEVLSKHTDLNITNINSTGEFSFYAVWDHIGYNTIEVQASAPGKQTSTLNYRVYYVPSASVYTPKAWPMNESNYSELLSTNVRQEKTQVYVVMGYIDSFVSDKPQMAVMYTSADFKSQPVLIENYSRTTWEAGTYYRIYADAYSTYNNMPWLCARYTYTY